MANDEHYASRLRENARRAGRLPGVREYYRRQAHERQAPSYHVSERLWVRDGRSTETQTTAPGSS